MEKQITLYLRLHLTRIPVNLENYKNLKDRMASLKRYL